MLKYRYILLVTVLLATSTFSRAESLVSHHEFASTDSLITIDTAAITAHISVIREIIRFNEVILNDTIMVDNKLQIKKITVEHTTISPIDTLFLVDETIEDELMMTDSQTIVEDSENRAIPIEVESVSEEEQKEKDEGIAEIQAVVEEPEEILLVVEKGEELEDEKQEVLRNPLIRSQYSSNYYLEDLQEEEPVIIAESTGEPIDLNQSITPINIPSNTLIEKTNKLEFTPASRAGLPGAKVLERRVISPEEAYDLTLKEIEKRRQRYAENLQNATNSLEKQQIIQDAASYLEETIAVDVVHYWYGTSFDKEGMSKNPNKGKIACSYFITTVLEDAGLKVNRIKLAQKSAENITKTLCNKGKMKRLTTPSETKKYVEENGKGLYVIGFSFHVGFLYNDGSEIYLIHASPLPPGTVARLPMDGARSFDYSKFYDIGKLSDNTALINKWLKGESIY
ncbi:MAG: hypothetical protein AB8B69_08710 [Chitinophagales bacterium]